MVIKGKFSRKAPPPKITIPKLHNTLIHNIAALKRKPNQQEALNLLYEIANTVGPIMEECGFIVKNLVEFSPKTDNLLGMNMNYGFKIFIRLRPPHNDDVFYPMNELLGTMLHELTHNKYGPHDEKFYKFLAELESKLTTMMIKGGPKYITEPFQGMGNRVGNGINSANVRDARLKRLDVKYHGSVQKLGGGEKKGDLKEMVRQAAIKRFEDNKWCHGAVKGDLPEDDELDIIEIDSDDDDGKNIKKRPLESIDDDESIKKHKEVILLDSDDNNDKKEEEIIDLTDD